MPFIAEAARIIDAPLDRAFELLADLESWPTWMPQSFRLVTGAARSRPLEVGDRFEVRIGGAPVATTLRMSVLDRPRELAWDGGVRWLLWAEHRFVFDVVGEGRTRVRSIETWRGLLAAVARVIIQPMAARIGSEQLEALAIAAATPASCPQRGG